MTPHEAGLHELAAAIVGGSAIDWATAESNAADDSLRQIIRELKVIADIADVHCSIPLPADANAASLLDEPCSWTLGMWGTLRLMEKVGEGAYGEVYRAWDTRLDREVALKILPASLADGDARATSIIQEGRLLARVRHPNVLTIYGAERIESRVGLWMEFIRGRTLEQVIECSGALTTAAAVDVGVELCRAVSAVHAAGLLHRDIKAHNVMVAEDERVVLMDFGSGRAVVDGSGAGLAGTPLYLAPELLRGEQATVHSDIYSVGVLLYHLLTDSYPVRGQTIRELRAAHERGERAHVRTKRPAVSAKLARVIERAIDPQPGQRYESADALIAALAALRGRSGVVRVAYAFTMAAVVILLAGIVLEMRGRRIGSPHTPTTLLAGLVASSAVALTEPAGAAAARVGSVAVLPFKPIVATEADERLQLGMTEAVINQLSRVKTLRVEPLARVRRYDALNQDPLEAGRALGVDAVLEGYFQQTDSGVRVRSRLLRTLDGTALAINEWHEPFRNILDVQRRLGESLADALQPTLTPAERARLRTQDTTNPEAFRHYMFGRYHLELRSVERMLQAEREFREALRLDPHYARAHAALSLTLTQMAWLDGRGIDVMGPAKDAAAAALAIDESVALAHSALARVYSYFDFDPMQAQAEHIRAMELDSQDAWVLRGYSTFLSQSDAFDEALELNRRELELNPTSPFSNRRRAMIFYAARRYDECVAECRKTLTLDPDDVALSYNWLARCLEQQGKQREAVGAWTKHHIAHGNAALAERMRQAYLVDGWEAYWRIGLRRLTDEEPSAVSHVRLGNFDEAIRSLERMYEARSPTLATTNHPEWDPLRSDSRFQQLRLRAGLSDEINAELAAARRAVRSASER